MTCLDLEISDEIRRPIADLIPPAELERSPPDASPSAPPHGTTTDGREGERGPLHSVAVEVIGPRGWDELEGRDVLGACRLGGGCRGLSNHLPAPKRDMASKRLPIVVGLIGALSAQAIRRDLDREMRKAGANGGPALVLTPSHSSQGGPSRADALAPDADEEPLPELVVLTLDQDYEQVAATGRRSEGRGVQERSSSAGAPSGWSLV